MKKTLVALIMCMAVSMQIFANQDIVVNHSNKTVTILANFITPAPITKSLYKAAELWNKKSGKYNCEMFVEGKKLSYTVHFKLVVNQNPLSDTALNLVTVLPSYHTFFASKTTVNNNGEEQTDHVVGVSDGKNISVSSLYQNNKYVLAHQMGHNLGLIHTVGYKCCYFDEKEIAIFEITHSVSDLADLNSTKHQSTRKFIELGSIHDKFVAENKYQ